MFGILPVVSFLGWPIFRDDLLVLREGTTSYFHPFQKGCCCPRSPERLGEARWSSKVFTTVMLWWDFIAWLSTNGSTLPETNIFSPENGWLVQMYSLLKWSLFRGELLVLGSVNQKIGFSFTSGKVSKLTLPNFTITITILVMLIAHPSLPFFFENKN